MGADVKNDDVTQVSIGYEKVYYSCNKAFWREHGRLLSRYENGLREQRKETGFFVVVVGFTGWV